MDANDFDSAARLRRAEFLQGIRPMDPHANPNPPLYRDQPNVRRMMDQWAEREQAPPSIAKAEAAAAKARGEAPPASEPMQEGLKVSGYTSQPESKVRIVNEHKEMEEMILRRLDAMMGMAEIDGRWLAIARTSFELAFMELNRAVFQPQRIRLPEDDQEDGA